MKGVQGGSEISNVVRTGNGGTDEKTGGGAGGGRVENVKICVRSDKNGQGMSTSEGQRMSDHLKRKYVRQDRWFGRMY